MTDPESRTILPAGAFDAVAFDLDGVVMRTAAVHARAWKRSFDEFLATRDQVEKPFDDKIDFRAYLDGKSRYEGAERFLRSRGIALARGTADDPAERETVCGLANRANDYFRDELARAHVEAHTSTVDLVRALRSRGIAVGVFSTSPHATAALEAVGIAELFDVIVDGSETEGRDGGGTAVLSETVARLDVEPERVVVVENAVAGIAAGRAGGFHLMIGVNRRHLPSDVARSDADVMIADLAEVALEHEPAAPPPEIAPLPSALEGFDEITSAAGERPIALFLDFDGTLTPIVERPGSALLSSEMRARITNAAKHATVAIVSGRDLLDLRSRVGIAGITFAGSHGFDIAGPEELGFGHQVGTEFVGHLDRAEIDVRQRLTDIDGSLVERKHFSIAVHYRNVAQDDLEAVDRAVARTTAGRPGLLRKGGKMVYEIQPDVDWDKGRAVLWLIEKLGLHRTNALAIYIGDDITDEDAFAALGDRGIGILVADAPRPTDARYRLEDPDEVGAFLVRISAFAAGTAP